MTDKLLPCPFCGGEAVYDRDWKAVQCRVCNARIANNFQRKKDAVEAWNTRSNHWHTGTPTEEGLYVIAYRFGNKIEHEIREMYYSPDYRIKPESTYRPYKDTEEMIEDFRKRFNAKVPPYAMPMIWVRNKTFKDCRLITVFRDKVVMIIVSGEDMKELFQDYTYLDGSPCGMKEG